MEKALFEKLTVSSTPLTLKQSVINNIERLLNCGGFLDDEMNSVPELLKGGVGSIYPNSLRAIVDQSSTNEESLKDYQVELERLILRFEPRVKGVQVDKFNQQGCRTGCRLKIALYEDEFEQNFVFNNE